VIPKLIHYTWVGPRPFPAEGKENLERWRALCPDYDFQFWTDANIDFSARFVREAYAAKAWNRVSNYVRMSALVRMGGIYLDHDVELRRPLDTLLANRCFLGFQTLDPDARDFVNGAVLGAEAGHPFIVRVRQELDAMDGRVDVASGSGPGLLSRIVREAGVVSPSNDVVEVAGITVYPPRTFYPYEWTETFSEAVVTPDTIAIHRWAHLWKKAPSFTAQLMRKANTGAVRLVPEVMFALNRWRNGRCH
jgi:mannosyltransferase OCH1-like enzyme